MLSYNAYRLSARDKSRGERQGRKGQKCGEVGRDDNLAPIGSQMNQSLTSVVSRAANDEDAGRGGVHLRDCAGDAQPRELHQLLS